MSNLRTSADCLQYIYLRAGESTTAPNFGTNAILYLNLAYRELLSGCSRLVPNLVVNFPWAKSAQPKTLVLVPSETGTCSITQNSSSVTTSGTIAASKVGYHIKFGSSDATTYRIDAHTAGTAALTLDSAVVAATNATSSYTLFKIDYSIGSDDVLRLADEFSGYIDTALGMDTYKIISEEEIDFRRNFPTYSQGSPTHSTLLKETSGTFTVRFNKYLSTTGYARLEAPYIPIPTDLENTANSIPLVPLHHRQTMCDLALFFLMNDKQDEKASEQFQLAQQGYAVMLKELGQSDVTFQTFKPNQEAKIGL